MLLQAYGTPLRAKTIRIPDDYPAIQEGILNSFDGDTVLVSDGVYEENIDFMGKGIILKSVNGHENTSIISKSEGHIVSFHTSEENASVLEGFLLHGEGTAFDAAISCRSSSPRVQDCAIVGHSWTGIECVESDPVIEGNTITGCSFFGVHCCGSSPQIQCNVIVGNEGGIYCNYDSSPLIRNNTITGNGTDGINCYLSSPTVTSNIITSNTGFGIYSYSSTPELAFNDVWGNGICDYQGAIPGAGDISDDPLFQKLVLSVPEDYTTIAAALLRAARHYLGEGSPCIDSGIEGENMGAYPSQTEYSEPGTSDIFVDTGTYCESLVLPPFTKLHGAGADETIIDAYFSSSVIQCFGGLDHSAIEDFTLQNGSMFGIYLKHSSPRIAGNVITGAGTLGIYCYVSSAKIMDNTITANGDGINCAASSPVIHGNTITYQLQDGINCYYPGEPDISENIIAFNDENGIDCDYLTRPTVNGNVITHNGFTGIDWYNSCLIIINNTISDNERHGIRCVSCSSKTEVINNTVTSNGMAGLKVFYSSKLSISYNDVWGNTSNNYSGIAPGPGDISEDPLYLDPQNLDYHLHPHSPCIDAGDPSFRDPDFSRSDMGACWHDTGFIRYTPGLP
jgi:parallel beta-helix repeat protein